LISIKTEKYAIIDNYKDPKKYKDINHNWLIVDLIVYHIDDTGGMIGNNEEAWGCTYSWRDDDFKLTKFSFKLLEKIMHLVVEKKFQNENILKKRN
jgi:hypothetical protein